MKSPEIADEADSQGMFALTNRMPTVQHLGDWKRPTGSGRTLQVGKRENGKLYRGYEKGKKFGDVDSLWFRSEVEFGTAGRHLPFEMLISPTQYFAGAYPFCLELVEHAKGEILDTVSRVPCTKKVSIHAPVMDAKPAETADAIDQAVSIHAPVMDAK